MHCCLVERHGDINGLAFQPYTGQGSEHNDDANSPCRYLLPQKTFVALPDAVELHAEELRDELDVSSLTVEPWRAVNLLMDIRSENLRQSERIDDRIEALRIRIAAVRNAIHNKEVDVRCSAKTMEERYFLAHPFRLRRMG